MINLKIDPEFQSQIPPLTDDEFSDLLDPMHVVYTPLPIMSI